MSKRTLVKSVITITDTAVNRIKYLINKNNDPNIIGVHLSTRLRGCNGNSYVMDYTKDKLLTDEHVHCKGINVYIDKKALFKVIGTKMDFVENKVSSEFIFTNPNAKGTCGCGESFHI
uniref:Iron-sulfur cluster biosynthesis protein n=1 Tax=Marseillevirus LCMAC202 TaxID=2506606 RepID=A0A481YYI2_9VIRU|nr:MAG: iron-sulfur cluster biosynthesis protein [Marseillevirus LCMAC202]